MANQHFLETTEIIDPKNGSTDIEEIYQGAELIWTREQVFTLSAEDAVDFNVETYLVAESAGFSADVYIYLPEGITANKITKGDISAYSKVTLLVGGYVHGAGGTAGVVGGDAMDCTDVNGTLYIENNNQIYGGCGGGGAGGSGGAGNRVNYYGTAYHNWPGAPLYYFTWNTTSYYNNTLVHTGTTPGWFIVGSYMYSADASVSTGIAGQLYIKRGNLYTGSAGSGGSGGIGEGYSQAQTSGGAGSNGTYNAGNGGAGGDGGSWAGTTTGATGATGASGLYHTAPFTQTTPGGTAGTGGSAPGKAISGTYYSLTDNGTVIGVLD